MSARIEKEEIIRRVAAHTGEDIGRVTVLVEAMLDEVYQAFKQGESVTLRNFGAFYVRQERENWVFRFNPSQKWRALFGWSSTYRGEP